MYIEPFNACMRKNTYLSMPAKPAAVSYILKSKKKKGKSRFNIKLIGRCLSYVGYGLKRLLGNSYYLVMGMWRNGKMRYITQQSKYGFQFCQ